MGDDQDHDAQLPLDGKCHPVAPVLPLRPEASRSLAGAVRAYEDPTEPVGVEDWEALRSTTPHALVG